MKLILLFIVGLTLLIGGSLLAQEQALDTTEIEIVNHQSIFSDFTITRINTPIYSQTFDFSQIIDCAHGHICCESFCRCCTERNRQQIYDSAFAKSIDGVERLIVSERYRYAQTVSLNPVHLRFRKENSQWSERYYPVYYYEGSDYRQQDQPFGQYSGVTEEKYRKDNRILVTNSANEFQLLDLKGNAQPFTPQSKMKIVDGFYLSTIIIRGEQYYSVSKTADVPILAVAYLEVQPFGEDGWAIVRRTNGLYGLLSSSGELQLPCNYNGLTRVGSNRFTTALNPEVRGLALINERGELLTPQMYESFGTYSDGLLHATDFSGNLHYLDSNGNDVICLSNTWGREFHDGMAAVVTFVDDARKETAWGFIDKTGAFVIPPQYKEVQPFYNGVAPVSSNDPNNWGCFLIDKRGKRISKATYGSMTAFKNGIAQVSVAGQGCGLIDTKGKELIPPNYSSFNEYLPAGFEVNGKIVRWRYDDSKSLAIVNRNNEVLQAFPQYYHVEFLKNDAKPSTVYPFMRVRKHNNTYNLMDETGKELLSTDYQSVLVLSETIVIGCNGENQKQQEIIDLRSGKQLFALDDNVVNEFTNGLIKVWKAKTHYEYEYYNLEGKLMVGY